MSFGFVYAEANTEREASSPHSLRDVEGGFPLNYPLQTYESPKLGRRSAPCVLQRQAESWMWVYVGRGGGGGSQSPGQGFQGGLRGRLLLRAYCGMRVYLYTSITAISVVFEIVGF